MDLNDDQLTQRALEVYQKRRPEWERLQRHVHDLLSQEFVVYDDVHSAAQIQVVNIACRVKRQESFVAKAVRRRYDDPFMEIHDAVGFRLVFSHSQDLDRVQRILESLFEVHEIDCKADGLGDAQMGYDGTHLTVSLGNAYSGGVYRGITNIKFEVQLRTILQDAWAIINHYLVYKNEAAVPIRLRRDLNNVSSLLEIAQSVFDSVSEKQRAHRQELREVRNEELLSRAIDFDSLVAYASWRYPELPPSNSWTNAALEDLDKRQYATLRDVDNSVRRAKRAVDSYAAEQPTYFRSGTDFITKSLGFVDQRFREVHSFSERTRLAFEKYGSLVES